MYLIRLPLSILLLLALVGAKFGQAQHQDTLLVGYKLSPPFVEEKNGELQGPSIWLWEQIASEHNFAYKYKQLPLDSLLKKLETNAIDVIVSPLTMTSQRAEKIHFSPPYHIANSAIMTLKKSDEHGLLKFIKSFFSLNFFKALGALSIVILIFGFLEWYFERKQNKEEFGPGIKGVWNGFWWSAVTMTTVGYGDKSPKTVGGRIVALIWMFTAIIIISGFTASISSSLTITNIGSTRVKIEDFKEKKLGTIDNSGTNQWLKDHFFSNKTTYSTMEQMLIALESGKIDAIAYDRPILQNIIKKDQWSKYNLLDFKYNSQFYAVGISNRLKPDLIQKIAISTLESTESLDWKVLISECDLN